MYIKKTDLGLDLFGREENEVVERLKKEIVFNLGVVIVE